MIIAALTGSIAMGKSETAKMFAARGIPVFDSDAAVHTLYAKGGSAVDPLRSLIPECIRDDAVDRNALTFAVMKEPGLLKKIEHIVHPLVRAMQKDFLDQAKSQGRSLVLLDIPLLFETGQDQKVDNIIVVSTSPAIQRRRALQRPGMSAEKLDFILSRQVSEKEKRRRAHYVIDTSKSFEDTAQQVDAVIASLRTKEKSK